METSALNNKNVEQAFDWMIGGNILTNKQKFINKSNRDLKAIIIQAKHMCWTKKSK